MALYPTKPNVSFRLTKQKAADSSECGFTYTPVRTLAKLESYPLGTPLADIRARGPPIAKACLASSAIKSAIRALERN